MHAAWPQMKHVFSLRKRQLEAWGPSLQAVHVGNDYMAQQHRTKNNPSPAKPVKQRIQESHVQNSEARDLQQELPMLENGSADEAVHAFCAELSSDTAVSAGSVIIFDRIITNEGELYFNATGIFGCVNNDIYFFTWAGLRTNYEEYSDRCAQLLRLGSEEVKYGPVTNFITSAGYSATAQMSALVQCSQLSSVTVLAAEYSNPPCSFTISHTSFSGFRVASSNKTVGFLAELSSDQTLLPGNRLFFDNVLVNYGEHYEANHGYFRCPDNNLYSFTISLHHPLLEEEGGQWSTVGLRLLYDGEVIMHGPVTYVATEQHDSGSSSITVILQCQLDKDIWVEADQSADFLLTDFGARLTSFMGFRIFDDNTSGQPIAFTVVLSHNISSSGFMTFDKVITNVGDCYNATTGDFVCPDDALYLFIWGGVSVSANNQRHELYLYIIR